MACMNEGEKNTVKSAKHTHTGHKRETIYIYVEESTSKHRASSSISTYYACRDVMADTGKGTNSYGGCAARNEVYSKGIGIGLTRTQKHQHE